MLVALQPVSGESVMTAAVHHCTTAPRPVITLSTPRQPAQLLGAHLLIFMHGGAALSCHQPDVAWCRDVQAAGCRISPTDAVQLSPVLGCATSTAAASTAVLQHCSQPDTLSAAVGQSKRPATVIEEFSKLRNMAIITAAVLFIQSSDIDSSYALYLSSTPKLTPRLQLLFVAFYGSLLYRK